MIGQCVPQRMLDLVVARRAIFAPRHEHPAERLAQPPRQIGGEIGRWPRLRRTVRQQRPRAGGRLVERHPEAEDVGAEVAALTLDDLGGDDVYECLQKSQGFGETRGVGVLVDAAGNDRYVADDSQVVDPSPQTAEHNVSLAQGCGYGRRAHPGDGWSYAGGIGILVDGGGDDHYSCGVFGQGTAYWYGLGFLVDLGGNDRYDGVWYVQGSAAHFALACLVDGAGNDRYAASMHQSQGAGHDLSVGVLVDGGGDDEYRCPGTCLGGGSWNGVGAFRDDGGNDHYVTGGQAIGWASGAEEGRRCIGVFVDRAGKDRYEPEPGPELLGPRVYGLRAR